ncbi:hypothetical protein BC939DRAFT_385143, partial [Gamsiella multidivaricata]|uniref:uncharacterized protein n=1 Tax=Gamsiella multidivaricata TaxID=101098 RepID=UPI002220A73B
PLTLPGFVALMRLFPNLETLKFTTNFFTYDHQFQGLTAEIYGEEIKLVETMILNEMNDRWSSERDASTCWIGNWHAPLTQEQSLRVGIMRPLVSSP